MASNSTSPRGDFWSWVRAALAFRPIGNRMLDDGDLPLIYRVIDYQAVARQGDFWRAKRLHLTVLLLAAVTAVLAERLDSRVQAVLAAVLYGLTFVIGVRALRGRPGADGHVERVAAESVKSTAWLYMVHGGSFHSRVADPDALFIHRVEEALRQLSVWGLQDPRSTSTAFGSELITPAMRAVRAKPFEARREIYLRDRLLEQTEWYRRASARAYTASVRWSAVSAGLTLVALLTAVLQAAGLMSGGYLAGLLSAAVAAAVAWQEAHRYRPRAAAYALVTQELMTLRIAMAATVTEEGWADAVAGAEQLVFPQRIDLMMGIST
ncbi:DUF4231 domain-containing protein [Streptomyces sp. NPDC048191]|uniref:DUF4231 domain-containing protein n=1 Tax=Streptomyces sp. NPDC048191 TaxID=3155484 RepID=UPI0034047FDF